LGKRRGGPAEKDRRMAFFSLAFFSFSDHMLNRRHFLF